MSVIVRFAEVGASHWGWHGFGALVWLLIVASAAKGIKPAGDLFALTAVLGVIATSLRTEGMEAYPIFAVAIIVNVAFGFALGMSLPFSKDVNLHLALELERQTNRRQKPSRN